MQINPPTSTLKLYRSMKAVIRELNVDGDSEAATTVEGALNIMREKDQSWLAYFLEADAIKIGYASPSERDSALNKRHKVLL
jgi:hypothetical protein